MPCRFADALKAIFNDVSSHIITNSDVWTMSDLVSVRKGTFIRDINALIGRCEEHVMSCEVLNNYF